MKFGRILTGPDVRGQVQMDLDSEMLAATERDGITRLRFYRFVPPSVSLGFHQGDSEIDIEECHRRGFHVVRRPTGGRAVLHKGDLVYSLSVAEKESSEKAPLHLGIYNLVSLAIIEGLSALGIEAGSPESELYNDQGRGRDLPKLCFSTATRHEVQVSGRKLVGSAQKRGHGAILQHGSILITLEHLEITELLAGLESEKTLRLRKALERRTACLRDAGYTGGHKELRDALEDKFSAYFGPFEEAANYQSRMEMDIRSALKLDGLNKVMSSQRLEVTP